jgi:hypothetical protein
VTIQLSGCLHGEYHASKNTTADELPKVFGREVHELVPPEVHEFTPAAIGSEIGSGQGLAKEATACR